jgi:KipI family sensor histidine kinase inhibitor
VKLEARDVSEGSLLLEFPDSSDDEGNARAIAIAARLSAKLPHGILDAIPGAKTLFILFDPRTIERDALLRKVRRAAEEGTAALPESRLFRIPVAYGADNGPDLAAIARDRGLDPDELVRRHAAAEYRVAFLGFSPGFAYLTGLPSELSAPRRESPRPRVPAGSVAIGGEYTAVYPSESPGGWRLIGRSPVRLFDPSAVPPALLKPGDRIRFESIDAEELERRFASGASREPRAVVEGDPVFAVIASGLFTTVQGAPRYGLGSCGVPAGGAMDPAALERGNALVGNQPAAAALEISLSGPELRVLDDALVCVSGAELGTLWNGKSVHLDAPFEVRAGDHVSFGYARRAARAYLCVRGGLVERLPGEPLRRLARGDVVSRARPARRHETVSRSPAVELPQNALLTLRVLPGPQSGFFRAAEADTFFSGTYRVTPESDRRGIRLDGPAVELHRPPDIPPEGTALGAIQIPASGLPIVLGPDRPVTGGYAKIATVVARDWPHLAQSPPGTAIRFQLVSLEEAVEGL